MIIAGIDAGLKGAITILKNDKIIAMRMPTIGNMIDMDGVRELLKSFNVTHVALEEQFILSNQGGNMTIAGNFWLLKYAIMDIGHVEIVKPQVWQKAFPIKPKGARKITKKMVMEYVRNTWGIDTKDDGIADSICIAKYLEKKLKYLNS